MNFTNSTSNMLWGNYTTNLQLLELNALLFSLIYPALNLSLCFPCFQYCKNKTEINIGNLKVNF